MLGEITMVQLYSVALTAGKAHRDHKHHHAHKYDHNGSPITTTPPPQPAPRPTQPTHPLLTAGQINPEVALNIAAQQPVLRLIPQQQDYSQQYVIQSQPSPAQGPLGPQVFQSQQQPQQQLPNYPLLPSTTTGNAAVNDISSYSQQSLTINGRPLVNSGLVHSSLVNPANVQYIDSPAPIETHRIYKRQTDNNNTRRKRKNANKRELYLTDGQLVQDSLISNNGHETILLNGLAGIGENDPVLVKQKENYDREPAEAEVKAVMSVCTGCDEEPFAKALVFGWRTVPKKLYSGAFYQPAIPECRIF